MEIPFLLTVAPYTALAVWLDSRLDPAAARLLLGLATWSYLLAWARLKTADERRELWTCMAVSGAMELGCTQLWGLYHYRLGPVPLYVFAGHGMIWLFASEAAAKVRREGLFAGAALLAAVVWAVDGLIRRADWHGAFYLVFFVPAILNSDRRAAYAATFFFTSALELWGVQLGTWHWSSVVPGLGWVSADPPSAIAGGYCFFALAARFLVANRTRLLQPLLLARQLN